ncbi:MAG: protein-tyrosine-phosphatase [Planctomycetia bacterium]|nr:MAG: protein-tyrosine-phosphatase [Planctomycetia bacterium]RIK56041.1 MAG: protein-tyrosine-phosphatase [Nitrospira sp.]
MFEKVHAYLVEREREFSLIPPERRVLLKSIADYAIERQRGKQPVRLLFVCTHNSRRSQLGQVWSATAAAYYGLSVPWTYSGGTESTAFNPRAVAALERAGLKLEKTTEDENPIYHVRFGDKGPVITAFSKTIGNAPNPIRDFCAIMVCATADRSCPVVPGAAVRFAVPYDDPKQSDGTPIETKTYDERCRQIAREMLYVMSLLKTPAR